MAGFTKAAQDAPLQQSAPAVLMVRPASFGWNVETAPSNRFQPAERPRDATAAARAVAEFDALSTALSQAGIVVHACADRADPACPDAVFPNNWVSMHADGTVVLYPMLAPSRRRERRLELIAELEQRGGLRVTRLLDLTHHELHDRFLEGTGSVVFDHCERVAYACISPRTDAGVLDELCAELGYSPVVFAARDRRGAAVYHTNVVLSVGNRLVVVCADAVPPGQRGALLERLSAGGRRIVAIDTAQMAAFAANVLELRAADGARVLAGSERGWASLSGEQRAMLEECVERRVAVPVPTIETLGGGSVRCMLAEVFLPPIGDMADAVQHGGAT